MYSTAAAASAESLGRVEEAAEGSTRPLGPPPRLENGVARQYVLQGFPQLKPFRQKKDLHHGLIPAESAHTCVVSHAIVNKEPTFHPPRCIQLLARPHAPFCLSRRSGAVRSSCSAGEGMMAVNRPDQDACRLT
jgi:hypothetical protein